MAQELPVSLITASEVISIAIPDQNYDSGYIKSATIKAVQYDTLYTILGNDYYNELLSEYGSYSSANQIIIDNYVKPFLAFMIVAKIISTTQFKITNAGGSVYNEGEFVKNAGKDVNDSMRLEAESTANIYKVQMYAYLNDEDNIASYPTYHGDGNREDESTANSDAMGGLVINRRSAN